jgi:hypothetical protein
VDCRQPLTGRPQLRPARSRRPRRVIAAVALVDESLGVESVGHEARSQPGGRRPRDAGRYDYFNEQSDSGRGGLPPGRRPHAGGRASSRGSLHGRSCGASGRCTWASPQTSTRRSRPSASRSSTPAASRRHTSSRPHRPPAHRGHRGHLPRAGRCRGPAAPQIERRSPRRGPPVHGGLRRAVPGNSGATAMPDRADEPQRRHDDNAIAAVVGGASRRSAAQPDRKPSGSHDLGLPR